MQLTEASAEFLIGYFSANQRSKKTKAAYASDLAQFGKFATKELALPTLSGSVIEAWAAHLRQEGYSPASIRRKIVVLKVFCSYWVRKGALPESPFWRVRLSYGRIEQLPRTLTEGEIRALLVEAERRRSAAADDGDSSDTTRDQSASITYRALRNLALVDLMFATGMRVGETSSLDLKDFVVEEGVFRVQGKGGRDRLAYVVDEKSLRIQREHLISRARIETQTSALFLNAAGKRLSTQGIANVIAKLRLDAGLERRVTPHMLRHTVATLLLRNGVDIRVVQEFLGHASIATTQRYTHVAKEHLIGVLRKSHPSLALRADP